MLPRRARSDRTTRDAAGPSPVSPPRCGWGYPHCAVGGGESGSRACPGMPAVRDRSRGVLLPRDRRAWRMDIPSRCPFHSRRGRLGDSAVGVSEGGRQHVGRSACSRNLCQHSRAPQRDFARRRPLDPRTKLHVDHTASVALHTAVIPVPRFIASLDHPHGRLHLESNPRNWLAPCRLFRPTSGELPAARRHAAA